MSGAAARTGKVIKNIERTLKKDRKYGLQQKIVVTSMPFVNQINI